MENGVTFIYQVNDTLIYLILVVYCLNYVSNSKNITVYLRIFILLNYLRYQHYIYGKI